MGLAVRFSVSMIAEIIAYIDHEPHTKKSITFDECVCFYAFGRQKYSQGAGTFPRGRNLAPVLSMVEITEMNRTGRAKIKKCRICVLKHRLGIFKFGHQSGIKSLGLLRKHSILIGQKPRTASDKAD